ncbi:MAG: TonB family protein [Deltaproteobacteria bacterium]|nr:TonB family protein [Deltaproteobacteria bacterium]
MSRVENERNEGSRLNGMILLSLLIHTVVLLLLFLTPSFPSPKLTFGPVYTVSLVNLSATMPERKSVTAPAKELMEAARTEPVQKKRVEPEQAIPIRSLESKKKQPQPDQTLEKAMAEIRRRAAATPATSTAPKTAAPASPEAAATPAPSPAAAGEADMEARMRAYYAMIWSRIKGKWALPQGILPGEQLEAVLDVTILRSGAVTEMNFEKRSGNRYFDDSALKAIQRAAPFPPLPAWVSGRSLDVGIRFHSSELRS